MFQWAGTSMAGPVYQFADFRLDCGSFELQRKGRALRMERKPIELLILLVSRHGELVTRWIHRVDPDHALQMDNGLAGDRSPVDRQRFGGPRCGRHVRAGRGRAAKHCRRGVS